jgi:hypothetical protein
VRRKTYPTDSTLLASKMNRGSHLRFFNLNPKFWADEKLTLLKQPLASNRKRLAPTFFNLNLILGETKNLPYSNHQTRLKKIMKKSSAPTFFNLNPKFWVRRKIPPLLTNHTSPQKIMKRGSHLTFFNPNPKLGETKNLPYSTTHSSKIMKREART